MFIFWIYWGFKKNDEKINLLGKFWTIIGGRNHGKIQKNIKVNMMGGRFGNMMQELYKHQLWNIEHQKLNFLRTLVNIWLISTK
jgi:hypothetical protein